MKLQDWERYSVDSLAEGESDDSGRLFLGSDGLRNLSGVQLLHAGVDTVRQMYTGLPKQQYFEWLIEAYRQGVGTIVDFLGYQWVIGAVSQDSGFKYRLQNNELGVIILFRSRHAKVESIGTHVKIELSPHFILSRGCEGAQSFMDMISTTLLTSVEPDSCAVHLSLDIQGWKPGKDFLGRFVSRSRTIYKADGIDRIGMDQGSIAVSYGDTETVTLGKVNSLQFTTYNKTRQAMATDKLDFWRSVWDASTTGTYDPDQDVQRIECRFHQSVLSDFARGIPCDVDSGECLDSTHNFRRFIDCLPHLTGLWRTALQTQRLDAKTGLIDPFWQLFRDDPRFYSAPPSGRYKRVVKTPGGGNEKNIQLIVGNSLSVFARHGYSVRQALHGLMNGGLWQDISNYYRLRGLGLAELREHIGQELVRRRLIGKAA